MKVRDVVKRLEADGWYEVRGGKGSHRKFRHAEKPGQVIIAGHDGDDMPRGLLSKVLKQAGLSGGG
jgi:predicted RNA binding protein YcfA (HicA-like mRNA interferase family)